MNFDIHGELGQQSIVEAAKAEFYLADLQLEQYLSSNQRIIIIQAKEGQIMNVSQINLRTNARADKIYATITDKQTNKNVLIQNGPRHKQLIQTASHKLELSLTKQIKLDENRFILHIKGNLLNHSKDQIIKF